MNCKIWWGIVVKVIILSSIIPFNSPNPSPLILKTSLMNYVEKMFVKGRRLNFKNMAKGTFFGAISYKAKNKDTESTCSSRMPILDYFKMIFRMEQAYWFSTPSILSKAHSNMVNQTASAERRFQILILWAIFNKVNERKEFWKPMSIRMMESSPKIGLRDWERYSLKLVKFMKVNLKMGNTMVWGNI